MRAMEEIFKEKEEKLNSLDKNMESEIFEEKKRLIEQVSYLNVLKYC